MLNIYCYKFQTTQFEPVKTKDIVFKYIVILKNKNLSFVYAHTHDLRLHQYLINVVIVRILL